MKYLEYIRLLMNAPRAQYKYLYAKMLDKSIILQAWNNLRKGKTKREEIRKIEENLDAEIEKMRTMILNTKPEGYEVEHPELAYNPPKVRRTKLVNERGKKRMAHLADIWEQWYFHIIVLVLMPIVMKRVDFHACGSIPGRGQHSGKKRIVKLIRKGKGTKYFLKTDIRHFYDSLRISVVVDQLRRDIADELFIYCITRIYRYSKKGIMIGFYISPWLANHVLASLDDMLLRIPGISTTRYMDDLVIFADNKKLLRDVLKAVRIALGQLRLKVKRNYQICRFDYPGKRGRIGRPLDYMGFVFFRDRTVIRKRILLAATRLARRLYKARKAGRRYYITSVKAMVSRIGWFNHTDSYNCYKERIKPYVNVGKLKKIISIYDKEVAKHDRMEKGDMLRQAA